MAQVRANHTYWRRVAFALLVGILALWLPGCGSREAVTSQSEARQIVKKMIVAHGGLERWKSAPTVSFEDRLLTPGASSPLVSRVTVEQGRRRAYLDYPDSGMRLGWDGERAWSENWTHPYPPRFMALLNYYFANLPWLTMDSGVRLGEPGTARLWDDPTEYATIRMTFEEGVGDTPDDYYLLYIHPTTHQLKAVEYVVTYAAILPEGVKASPPNVVVYETYGKVDGLTVPTRYTIYAKKDRSVQVAWEIRDWSFSKPFDTARLMMPEGAVVDKSLH